MASFIPLQQFFGNATDNSNSSANGTMTSEGPTTFSNDISSFLVFLYSFSALRDWLRLIVIGGIFDYFRRLLMTGYYKFVNLFFIRASFDSMDSSYGAYPFCIYHTIDLTFHIKADWILVWLSRQPSWSKTRDMHITTCVSGKDSPAVVLEGEEDNSHSFKSSRKIAYLPSTSMTYSLWFKRRWMTITRAQLRTGPYGDKEDTLYISILTRDHGILTDLLQEARRLYMANQEHSMCIYVPDSSNRWIHVACRAKRSLNSIVLDPGVKDVLLQDARDFLQSKSWYAERGIPFRRGYLLYGAPGSGKTSMIHCMAGELKLDVYIISLSRLGLDDASLSELVNALPERCIALMEDIDAAFIHRVSRDGMSGSDDEDQKKSNHKQKQMALGAPPLPTPTPNRLSLSGLLNALDGVGAQEGRILFATTNRYSLLDRALCRPGRMDLHIEFRNASKYQARELFSRFYLPTPADSEGEDIHDSEKPSDDFGSSDKSKLEGSTTKPAIDLSLLTGQTHTGRAPSLSPARIAELAERFSDVVPDRECSMASLQGYLMSYKTRPVAAVDGVAEWVEEERKGKQEKENEEKEKKDKRDKRRDRKRETEETKKPQESGLKSKDMGLIHFCRALVAKYSPV